MITDEQLREWKRLSDLATPGLWEPLDRKSESDWLVLHQPDEEESTDLSVMLECDARFCAAARTAVPALIAEVDRLWECHENACAAHYDAEVENEKLRAWQGAAIQALRMAQNEMRYHGSSEENSAVCAVCHCLASVPKIAP